MKLPFLTTRCLYGGVDLPIWALTVEISYCHCWPVDVTTRGVDLPVDLPIWALTVEMSYHHSWPLHASTRRGWSANMSSNSRNLILPLLTTRCLYWGVDLPVDVPIWALTVEISYCHSSPLDATTGGRSASWSANMSINSRNIISLFLTTRCHCQGVDLPNLNTFYVSCLLHRGLFVSMKDQSVSNMMNCPPKTIEKTHTGESRLNMLQDIQWSVQHGKNWTWIKFYNEREMLYLEAEASYLWLRTSTSRRRGGLPTWWYIRQCNIAPISICQQKPIQCGKQIQKHHR